MVLPMSFDLQGLRLQVVRCGQGYDRSCEPKIESASVDTADKREATALPVIVFEYVEGSDTLQNSRV
ncbi:hypothetical protein WJX79_001391 [Trebouxia sp. C0005]